jgi:predicted nuclease with TOPRIM domain
MQGDSVHALTSANFHWFPTSETTKAEKTKLTTEMALLTEERDQLRDHIQNIEKAFEELRQRYEARKTENEELRKVRRIGTG